MDPQDIPKARTTAKRPESTIAQNFAADLDSMFGLTPEFDGLFENVAQKKTSITTSNMELQELEARLRATEQRLAKVSRNSSPARVPPPVPTMQHREEQQSMGGAQSRTQPTSSLAQRPLYPADRPPTAPSRRPPMPPDAQASMPGPFPSHMQHNNMSNEYIMVESHGDRYR